MAIGQPQYGVMGIGQRGTRAAQAALQAAYLVDAVAQDVEFGRRQVQPAQEPGALNRIRGGREVASEQRG